MSALLERLLSMRDEQYRAFQCDLMPGVDRARVLGVRMPKLRALEREMRGTDEADAFMRALPHETYEEDNLHALLISQMRSERECIEALDAFLPHVDNWATCDTLSPRAFRSHSPAMIKKAKQWMNSPHTYTARFGIGVLMKFCLGEAFDEEQMAMVASVQPGRTYVDMMVAWYFATALALQPEAAMRWIEGGKLDPWTRGKAIQKALESRRVPPERKEALRALRQKRGRTGAGTGFRNACEEQGE